MTKPALRELPIAAILDGPNIRAIEIDDELKELALSLSRQGFLAPIGAVEADAGIVITLYGFRRLAAYRWGVPEGLPMPETVPVLVYPSTLTLVEREAIQLIENLQRKDLTEVEYHHAVKALQSRGLTLDEIGDQVGRSRATVCKWLSPDRCPEEARAHFLAGRLSLGQCYSISTSADPHATLAAFLQGATVAEAGRRGNRQAAAGQTGEPKEKTPRVTVQLPPADASGSLGSVTICGRSGQGIDLVEAERLLCKALKLVQTASTDGLEVREAQTRWKVDASAKPLPKAARKRQTAKAEP